MIILLKTLINSDFNPTKKIIHFIPTPSPPITKDHKKLNAIKIRELPEIWEKLVKEILFTKWEQESIG